MIPNKVNIRGTGIPGLTAELVKKNKDESVAMFLRNDGYYEIGIVKYVKQNYTFPNGKEIKAGDFTYWNNDDFGSIAQTTKFTGSAYNIFDRFNERVSIV